jgi:hypothetical protein
MPGYTTHTRCASHYRVERDEQRLVQLAPIRDGIVTVLLGDGVEIGTWLSVTA